MLNIFNIKLKKKILSLEKRIFWRLHLKNAISKIRAFKSKKKSIESIIEFAFSYSGKGFYSNLGLLQNKSEILNFSKLLNRQKIENICEIGTFKGGTLFIWSQIASKNANIISIDLPGGPFGGGYSKKSIPFFKSFLDKNQKLIFLRGNSHSEDIKEKFIKSLGKKKLDFLFIDGDHTYEGVKKDFLNYSPFVKKGGLIAFHDIIYRETQKDIAVYKFWMEIKQNYRFKEYIDLKKHDRPIGIGLIYI
jgi:predicted O-methyltransferase YrrM